MTSACGREDPEGDGAESQRQPRLAVLVPVFNDQEGLQKSLASLASERSKFDVFVVDDGSRPPIGIPPGLPYKLQLIRQEKNQGITAALNTGLAQIAECGYEYVARLDAGDLSLPGRFAAQLAFLDGHPEHAAVGTATRYVDTRGTLLFNYHPPTEHGALARFYRYRSGLVHPSVMIRTEALLTCGFYSDRFPGGEDYDLFMRLAKRYELANLEPIFLVKEVVSTSITSKRRSISVSRLKILLHHFDPWSIHSYIGIATNTLLMLAPRSLMLRAKKFSGVRRARTGRPN